MTDNRGAGVSYRAVSKSFGAASVLRDFSLEIAAGEFLTLLGPSGSGKTTLLNLLAGFHEPDSGAILIDGVPVTTLPPEQRNIGMVFQNYALFPHMNVAQNVGFPLRMRRLDRAVIESRAAEALALVGLAGFGQRMPNELSGGQRQRVAFARAIVFQPKVLLMDEPLGALDLKLRERMQIEIKHYQRQIGCTVVYVTHDQSEALTLSDRIVILSEGNAVQIGTPLEIYDRPASRFVASFIGEANILGVAQSGAAWRIPSLGVDLPAALTAGTAFLSLRPERIARVSRADAPGLLSFAAEIVETVFIGEAHRCLARMADASTIVFKESRQAGAPDAPLPGQIVQLGFRLADAVQLPSDPAKGTSE